MIKSSYTPVNSLGEETLALQKKADSNIIATIANRILVDTSLEESVKK